MDLNRAWSDAWRKQYGLGFGWVVNADPAHSFAIGDVVRNTGESLNYEKHLEAVVSPSVPGAGDGTSWEFRSNKDCKLATAVKGQTSGAIGWLGTAEAGIKGSFGKEGGVVAFGNDKWFVTNSDMDAVKKIMLDAYHNGQLSEGQSVVVEIELTGRGLMLVAEGETGNFKATASASVEPGSKKIGDFSANFSFSTNSGRMRRQLLADKSVLAMRLLTVGYRGFWWWRKIEVWGGIGTATLEEMEMLGFDPVEGDGERHYFALYPDPPSPTAGR